MGGFTSSTVGPASKRVKVTREYSVVLKEKKNKEKVQFSFNIFFKFRRIQCSISEVLKNNNNIKKCATTPKVKKPACFSSGSFNFRLLFFSSAALLTPLPLENSCLIKKVVAGCLAFENSYLGRRLLCCQHLSAAIGALLRTTAFSVWTLQNISKSGTNIFPR